MNNLAQLQDKLTKVKNVFLNYKSENKTENKVFIITVKTNCLIKDEQSL